MSAEELRLDVSVALSRELLGVFKTPGSTWKILVLDEVGKRVIAPLFSVGKLRALGVTLTLMLHAPRHNVRNSTAVYFVTATRENLSAIAQDARQQKYSEYYVDFVGAAPAAELDAFAAALNAAPAAAPPRRVFERFARLLALRQQVFSLEQPTAFADFFVADPTEAQLARAAAPLLEGLLSLCVTLRCTPHVAFSNAPSPAQYLGEQLAAQLTEFAARNAASAAPLELHQTELGCPTLLLVNRMEDIAPAFAHFWTYGQLIYDVLQVENNFVLLDGAKHDLSGLHDAFFLEHCDATFPEVAAHCADRLKSLSAKVKRLNTTQSASGALQQAAGFDDAVRFMREKAEIDKHTAICQALLQKIKEDAIDKYSAFSNNLLAAGELKPAHLEELRELLSLGADENFLRAALLATHFAKPADVPAVQRLYTERFKTPPPALANFCKSRDKFSQLAAFQFAEPAAGRAAPADPRSKLLGSVMGKSVELWRQLVASTYVPATATLLQKTLRRARDVRVLSAPDAPPASNALIVFFLGGGNFYECSELHKWAAQNKVTLLYGASDFENARAKLRCFER